MAAALALAFALEPLLGGARAEAEEEPPAPEPSAKPKPQPASEPTAGAEAAAKTAFAQGSDAFRLGRYPEAIQRYEDAYRLSHKVEILFNLALSNRKAYAIEQKPEYLRRALDIYKQFLRLTPDEAELRAARQNISEAAGELAAVEERERLQRLRAGSDPPQLQAAMKLVAEGRASDAVGQLEALLEKGGNPAFVVQDAYRLEGEIAAQAEEHAVSTRAYEKQLALSPSFDLPKTAARQARPDFEKARAIWAEHGAFSVSPVVPPPAEPDTPLVVPVTIENDALSMVARVTIYYRRAGASRYSSVSRAGAGDIDIPGLALPGEDSQYRVEYYIAATDQHGNVLTTIGGATAPLSFPVLSPEEVTTFYRRETPWYATWLFGAFNSGAPQSLNPPLQLNLRPRR